MAEREYIVSLNKGVDYDQFWDQIENASTEDGFVPTRRVDIVNERPGSLRSCHYSLTEAEASQLQDDPRVFGVEIPPDQRDDVEIGLSAIQTGDFTKTTSDSGDFVNWGLRRCISNANPYGSGLTENTGQYTYNLDGEGVDVVIQDSGIQPDHPDFNDANGVSRVQQIDWYAESGLPGTQNANHYRDFNGHGTHCAGIAAGNTYGWAKNSRIYSVKVNGLEGSGDSGTGISISDCFDVIKLWHRNKPIDPRTKRKRPTIVNMSWGYGSYFYNVTGGNYRGTSWSGSSRRTDYGMVGTFASFFYGYRYGTRVASVDADLQELIDEGVHVTIAAGNTRQKIDVLGGTDYDNYFNSSSFGSFRYYNRGGSPADDEAISVGNIDSGVHGTGVEQKAISSENGPGVDIYAPGTDIMSTTSTINEFSSGDYPADPSFKICNISGTSMAAPQVCGVGALVLSANPHMTPAQLKSYLTNNCTVDTIYTTGLDNDYNDSRSIKGGNNRYLYNPFNSQYVFRILEN